GPSRGTHGLRRRRRPTSSGRRFSFLELHRRQDATTLSHVCGPPADLGITWSTFYAAPPQYWQAHPSRANTARRVSAAWARWGTWTKYRSRTTEGATIWIRSAW